MKFIEKLELIERLAFLIDRKATGPPEQLALRLNISKRHVHNVIQEMREMGGPIDYCSKRKTYFFTRKVHFNTGFISKDEMMAVRGGKGNYLSFLYKMWANRNN